MTRAPLPDRIAHTIAAAAGASVWIVIGLVADRSEAWDAPLYWHTGYPLLALAVAALAYFAPTRPWRWAFTAMLAQGVVMILKGPIGNLLPLGLVFFAGMSLPLMLPALLVAKLATWRARSRTEDAT